jgi:hypothetical protein
LSIIRRNFRGFRATAARNTGTSIKVVRTNRKLGEMGPIFCI